MPPLLSSLSEIPFLTTSVRIERSRDAARGVSTSLDTNGTGSLKMNGTGEFLSGRVMV